MDRTLLSRCDSHRELDELNPLFVERAGLGQHTTKIIVSLADLGELGPELPITSR
jgi:hypothetical protein